ncbi:AtpZ/AtpI family protein [Alkalicoccus urumqiensis]|nr:AtpZ/AtpI family protein [Alkalicoccus urumqiensis]
MVGKRKRPQARTVLKAFALMSTISSYIIGAVLFGVLLGGWLDNRFDTAGIWTVVLLLTGLGAAMYGIYETVQRSTGDNNNDDS